MNNTTQLVEDLASELHAGQWRKQKTQTGERIPYIDHPAKAASAADRSHASDIVVAATWLHDAVEDQPGRDPEARIRALPDGSGFSPSCCASRSSAIKVGHGGSAWPMKSLIYCVSLRRLFRLRSAMSGPTWMTSGKPTHGEGTQPSTSFRRRVSHRRSAGLVCCGFTPPVSSSSIAGLMRTPSLSQRRMGSGAWLRSVVRLLPNCLVTLLCIKAGCSQLTLETGAIK